MRRFFHLPASLLRLPVLLALLVLLAASPAHAADEVDIVQSRIESVDDAYALKTRFGFDLNRGLEDAVSRGVPLYFTMDLEIRRPRWYWFDAKTVSTSQTMRIAYNVLTRQYHAGVVGKLQQSFPTLDDALSLIRRPGAWPFSEKAAFKSGEIYSVSLRMRLDVTQLPKPFQVNALNNSDWQFGSDWKQFTFKAD